MIFDFKTIGNSSGLQQLIFTNAKVIRIKADLQNLLAICANLLKLNGCEHFIAFTSIKVKKIDLLQLNILVYLMKQNKIAQRFLK
jgi:hypothetical protein